MKLRVDNQRIALTEAVYEEGADIVEIPVQFQQLLVDSVQMDFASPVLSKPTGFGPDVIEPKEWKRLMLRLQFHQDLTPEPSTPDPEPFI